MTLTPTQGSQSNTYVPELIEKLVIDYSRNIRKFPINRYVQIVPVKKQKGFYPRMSREEAGRLLQSSGANFSWPDNQNRPDHNGEMEEFAFWPFSTMRWDFGFNVGQLAEEQASFDIVAHNAGIKAEQAMRWRTSQVLSAATTTSNYDSNCYVSDITSITGVTGKWSLSTTSRMDIKRSLDYAVDTIITQTLNGVQPADMMLVISRGCARQMSVCQEIINMISHSPEAYAEMRGELPNRNIFYGLPNKLYGYDLIVEDTAKTTSRKGAASVAKTTMLADATPFMCSRVGALVSERASESSSFSTHILFMKEEMTVEQFQDPKNRKLDHHITEDYQAIVASPISGFLFGTVV